MSTEKKPQIFQAMINIMRSVGAVEKDKKQQGFQYRGIDDVYNALHKIMADHGVFMVSDIKDIQREQKQLSSGKYATSTVVTIQFSFIALDGSSVQTMAVGEGFDMGDKSAPKSLSIAHKYALLMTLLIPTEDMADPDADTHEASTDKVAQEIAACTTLDGLANVKTWIKSINAETEQTNAAIGIKYSELRTDDVKADIEAFIAGVEQCADIEALKELRADAKEQGLLSTINEATKQRKAALIAQDKAA